MLAKAPTKKAGPGRPPKPGGRDRVVPVRLSNDLLGRIDVRAEADGVSRSDAMRAAIEAGLKRKAK